MTYRTPKSKKWYSVFLDGKLVAVNMDSLKFRKEIKRLTGLKGVKILLSTYAELRQFNAKTPIPPSLIVKFENARIRATHPIALLDPFSFFENPYVNFTDFENSEVN